MGGIEHKLWPAQCLNFWNWKEILNEAHYPKVTSIFHRNYHRVVTHFEWMLDMRMAKGSWFSQVNTWYNWISLLLRLIWCSQVQTSRNQQNVRLLFKCLISQEKNWNEIMFWTLYVNYFPSNIMFNKITPKKA